MSIFVQDTDVPQLIADRLLRVAANYFPDFPLTPAFVWEKLLAEEAALEDRLRMFFSPREVVPHGAPAAEIAALQAAGKVVVEEPGYDYDSDFFTGTSWGSIQLRSKPIIDVHSIDFAYPKAGSTLYTIPSSWVRPDKKYGRISLVPADDLVIGLPLNSFLLSMLASGRSIPLMIQVRYSAGMPDIRTVRPEIVDVIKKLTVLSILDDQYFPTSGSDSIDGLSQSMSLDVMKLRESVEKRIEQLKQSTGGIRLLVC